MPNFEQFFLVQWIHFVALAVGGGGAVAALLLSGFEDTREDLRGLAAAMWAKLCTWSFRVAFLLGIALLVIQWRQSGNPFATGTHLYWKLPLVALMLFASELSPKSLAVGKRGAPLLALALFLVASFVAVNRGAFDRHPEPRPAAVMAPAR